MQRALVAGLTSLLVAACGGPAAHSSRAASPEELARQRAEFEPFAPAFQSLQAALDARDDELALRILTRIMAREPQGAALERAHAFERILEGRAWTSGIKIRLEAARVGASEEWIVRAL